MTAVDGAGRMPAGVRRGCGWLLGVVAFVAALVDALVTAWLGIAPVLPRLRWWWQRLVTHWRDQRAGVVQAEIMDGVWR